MFFGEELKVLDFIRSEIKDLVSFPENVQVGAIDPHHDSNVKFLILTKLYFKTLDLCGGIAKDNKIWYKGK